MPLAGQVEGAVDVLDDDDGAGRDLEEEGFERGVVQHAGELEIVHVVMEVVCDCSD